MVAVAVIFLRSIFAPQLHKALKSGENSVKMGVGVVLKHGYWAIYY